MSLEGRERGETRRIVSQKMRSAAKMKSLSRFCLHFAFLIGGAYRQKIHFG